MQATSTLNSLPVLVTEGVLASDLFVIISGRAHTYLGNGQNIRLVQK